MIYGLKTLYSNYNYMIINYTVFLLSECIYKVTLKVLRIVKVLGYLRLLGFPLDFPRFCDQYARIAPKTPISYLFLPFYKVRKLLIPNKNQQFLNALYPIKSDIFQRFGIHRNHHF